MKKVLPLVTMLFLLSCGKPDDVAPVITMISPSDNQVFNGGQTIAIKADISDNEGIHMVHLTVTDNNTGGHLVHFEEHLDAKTFSLDQSFDPLAGRSYKIEIGATDHNENLANKELTVTAN